MTTIVRAVERWLDTFGYAPPHDFELSERAAQ